MSSRRVIASQGVTTVTGFGAPPSGNVIEDGIVNIQQELYHIKRLIMDLQVGLGSKDQQILTGMYEIKTSEEGTTTTKGTKKVSGEKRASQYTGRLRSARHLYREIMADDTE